MNSKTCQALAWYKNHKSKFLFISLIISIQSFAQEARVVTLEQAINESIEKNLMVKSSKLQAESQKSLVGSAWDLPKTNLAFTNGQYNSVQQDNNITITQNLAFPTVYSSQKKYLNQQAELANQQTLVTVNDLKYQVKQVYYQLLFLQTKASLLQQQDSIYANFSKASNLRYKLGESNLLEQVTAETQLLEIRNLIQQNDADINIAAAKLQLLMNSSESVSVSKTTFTKKEFASNFDTSLVKQNPALAYYQKNILVNEAFTKTEKSKRMPDLSFGYFNQTLTGYQNTTGTDRYFGSGYRFQGFTVGIAVPIWMKAMNAKINVASINEKIANQNYEFYNALLKNDYANAVQEFKKCERNLNFYEQTALKQADLILQNAQKAFKGGAVNYLEYSMALTKVLSIQNNHLDELLKYNLAIVRLEYVAGL